MSEKAETRLVEVPCNLCGSTRYHPVTIRPDGMQVVTCHRCGLMFINPRPAENEIFSLYGKEYFTSSDSVSTYSTEYVKNTLWMAENVDLTTTRAADVLAEIEELLGYKGTVLDIGCSLGSFLLVARELEWKTKGVELSEYAADLARKEFGLDVTLGTLEEAAFPPVTFDAVTMFDVIEHFSDPRATLTEVARCLKRGGVLYVLTPNAGNVKQQNHKWLGFQKNFEHLYFFSSATLHQMMVPLGFDIMRVRTVPHTNLERRLAKGSYLRSIQRALFHVPALYKLVRSIWRGVNRQLKSHDEEQGTGHGLELLAIKRS